MAQWGTITFRANVNLHVLIIGFTRNRDSAVLTARMKRENARSASDGERRCLLGAGLTPAAAEWNIERF